MHKPVFIILPWAMARNPRRSTAGFTLLELMIVVVIIAVLAAIAIPAYSRYGFRARRADGKNEIMRIANLQERYYTANNAYNVSASAQTSEKGHYTVSIASAGSAAQSYTITGTPIGDQVGDKCGNLTYTDTGVKGWTGNESNGDCW